MTHRSLFINLDQNYVHVTPFGRARIRIPEKDRNAISIN